MLKGRVLLLNASFEVIGTIGVARAIRMQLRESNPIHVLENTGAVLHSASGKTFETPSVVRLTHYIDIRKKREESGNGNKRLKIYLRDHFKCQYCNMKVGKMFTDEKGKRRPFEVKDFTLDHITPKAQGGNGHPTNLATSCKACNTRKADRTPEQAKMPLRTPAHDIKTIGTDKLLICRYVEKYPEWVQYLEGQEGYDEALKTIALAKAA